MNIKPLIACFNIPVVEQHSKVTNPDTFMEYVRELKNAEGFVIRWSDGYRVKIKAHEYVQIHKAKEKILQDRNIVELILDEKIDDVKAHLPEEDRDRLTVFESDFNLATRNIAAEILAEIVDLNQRNIDRKTFATTIAPGISPYIRPIIFSLWDTDPIGMVEVRDKVLAKISENLTRNTKYDEIRDAWFPNVIYNN